MKLLTRIACILLFTAICFCSSSFGDAAASSAVKLLFEKKYSIWKKDLESSREFLGDDSGTMMGTYDDITALGIPAIPFIMEKLHEDPSLYLALRKITKKMWYWDECKMPADRILINWWSKGQDAVEKKFCALYENFKEIKSAKKSAEEVKLLKRFEDLGIAALPYMFEKISQGELEFMPIVSRLTNGAITEKNSVNEFIVWWKKNKNDWLIPFPDQNLYDR